MSIPAAFLANLTSFHDQRVLVTGGAGFLGRHIVELLVDCGCKEVIVFDVVAPRPAFASSAVTAVVGNLLQLSQLQPHFSSLYAVFHVASPSPTAKDAALFNSVNVDGTRNVIAACSAGHVPRLVYTSSASVVFDGRDQRNWDESAPVLKRGMDAYTASKYRAERLVLQACDSASLFTCAIRPHGIFGPRDPALLPSIHRVAVTGKSRWQIGDGSNLVDFTYVANVAYAHLLACCQLGPKAAVNGQAYFITNRQPVLFWDFFSRMFNELGWAGPTVPLPVSMLRPLATVLEAGKSLVPSLPVPVNFTLQAVNYAGSAHYYSCEKAVRDFGYFPAVSVEKGIRRSIAASPHLQRQDGQRWKEEEFVAPMASKGLRYAAVAGSVLLLLVVTFRSALLSWLWSLSLWAQLLLALHVLVLTRQLWRQTSMGAVRAVFREKPDLTGVTVVITGANKGVGYETALLLARLHATVILACRDTGRGAAAVERIQRLTNNPNVSCQHLDLGSLDSVKRFAQGLQEGAMRIDVLVHNAGAMVEKSVTEDGFDSQLQCNYLSSLLLTLLLLRDSSLSPSARIVFVSSIVHHLGHVDLTDLNSQRSYSRIGSYNNTKLMQIAATFRLQHHLDQQVYDNIASAAAAADGSLSPRDGASPSMSASSLLCRRTAVAVHPGSVVTDFHYHFLPRIVIDAVRPLLSLLGIARPMRSAADTVVYACVSKELVGVGGVFVDNCRIAVASREARSRKVQEALWQASLDMLKRHLG